MIEIATTRIVQAHQIADLLITAFETPDGDWFWSTSLKPDAHYLSKPGYCFTVRVEDPDDETGRPMSVSITQAKIEKGLQKLADDYPSHFSDIMDDSPDATTADCFLQCVVYGDIIYG